MMPYLLYCGLDISSRPKDIVEENIMYQDNKSTILLAMNGHWSSSKRMKHIKPRYFLVKDKIAKGELYVEHQPTEKMWSDVLTKPKQGRAFKQERAHQIKVLLCEGQDSKRRVDS